MKDVTMVALQCLLPVSLQSMRSTTSVKISNSDYFLFPAVCLAYN